MRSLALILFVLTACTVVESPIPNSPQSPPTSSRSPQQAVDAYLRVGARIERVAEQVCRQKNPSRPRTYCDFQLKVDTSETNVPNAFQTIGKDGRPIIAFNIAMLANVRNDDEIAFILGHEAGHQIASHLVRANTNANLGALLLGGLLAASGANATSVQEAQNIGGTIGARAYSQTHELEADVLGHPPSQQRVATVQRTVQKIAQDRAAGRPIMVP